MRLKRWLLALAAAVCLGTTGCEVVADAVIDTLISDVDDDVCVMHHRTCCDDCGKRRSTTSWRSDYRGMP